MAPPSARAHLGHQVVRAERYLKIDAGEASVRVVVSLSLGPAEIGRIMQAADGNGDFEVTQAEADAYMAEWGEGLKSELPVTVDGERIETEWAQPYFDPIGQVRSRPGAVELIATIPLTGGEHTISITDGMRTETFDRTDVRFESHDGAEVVKSGAGQAPTDRVQTFAYGERVGQPLLDNQLTVIVRVPGAPEVDSPAPDWLMYALGGGALLALILGGAFFMLRRRG